MRHKKISFCKNVNGRIALATIGFGAFKAIKEFLKLSNEEHEFSAIVTSEDRIERVLRFGRFRVSQRRSIVDRVQIVDSTVHHVRCSHSHGFRDIAGDMST